MVIKRDDKFYIAWLNYVLARPVETREEIDKMIEKERFEITAMYILAILEEQKKGFETRESLMTSQAFNYFLNINFQK